MSRDLMWAVSAVVLVAGGVGVADAQLLSGRANVLSGTPKTAKPAGSWSVPDHSGRYKVVWEYGTLGNGQFIPNPRMATGGTVYFTAGTENGWWSDDDRVPLPDPLPMWATGRAQLFRYYADGAVWKLMSDTHFGIE